MTTPTNLNPIQQAITIEAFQPHMIKTVALLLLEEWKELDQFTGLHPLHTVDHVTAVQIFNKLGLNRVSDILHEVDQEYLNTQLFKNSKFECAKAVILTGELPRASF